MEDKHLPKCHICGSVVVGFSMTSEEVFTENGPETIQNSVVLSCGCAADFVKYNIDFEEGYVELEDLMIEKTLIEWKDPNLLEFEEDD